MNTGEIVSRSVIATSVVTAPVMGITGIAGAETLEQEETESAQILANLIGTIIDTQKIDTDFDGEVKIEEEDLQILFAEPEKLLQKSPAELLVKYFRDQGLSEGQIDQLVILNDEGEPQNPYGFDLSLKLTYTEGDLSGIELNMDHKPGSDEGGYLSYPYRSLNVSYFAEEGWTPEMSRFSQIYIDEFTESIIDNGETVYAQGYMYTGGINSTGEHLNIMYYPEFQTPYDKLNPSQPISLDYRETTIYGFDPRQLVEDFKSIVNDSNN